MDVHVFESLLCRRLIEFKETTDPEMGNVRVSA